MSTEQNKAIIRRWFEEGWDKGNLDIADELFAGDYVHHEPDPYLAEINGPEHARQHHTTHRTAFPDLQVTIEDVLAEDDEVVVRWTAQGTHADTFKGVPATGNQAQITAISWYHLEQGKIKESWGGWDTFSLMQAMQLLPRREQASQAMPSVDRPGEQTHPTHRAHSATEQNNEAVVRRWYAEAFKGNVDIADEVFAPTYVDHGADPLLSGQPGPEGPRQHITAYLAGFPDGRADIDDLITEGDKVAIRITGAGTQTGTYLGQPPTGKRVEVTGVYIYRLVDGKIVETWGSAAAWGGMMEEVGLTPTPGQAGQ